MDFFSILHFNDVYHLSEVDGVSKFASVMTREAQKSRKSDSGFTIFSGDCFSPSLECSISQGGDMIPVLNQIGIDVACPGNHDFDYGERRLKSLLEKSAFPWTLCNYLDPAAPPAATSVLESQNLLVGASSYVIRTKRGVRFGFFGLGGTDWPSLCQNLPPCRVEDPVTAARTLARHLRQVHKCDVVIAITHMRLAEDLKVAEATWARDDSHVDLLLGGHDHETVCRVAGDTCQDASKVWQNAANEDIIGKGQVMTRRGRIRIIKSGSDFKSFSKIGLLIQRSQKGKAVVVQTTVRQVTDLSLTPGYHTVQPHLLVQQHLLDVQSHLSRLIETPLARIGTPLDGRETLMRCRETNLGNFLCDMLKLYYDTDVAFTNSGSIRSDKILGVHDGVDHIKVAGTYSSLLRVRDVLDMLPFRDTFEVKVMTKRDLRQLLEVSVSENSPEGKFLQISGVSFEVDKRLPPGRRISNMRLLPPVDLQRRERFGCQAELASVAMQFEDQSEDQSEDRLYTAVMPSFLARGYDGYDAIRNLPSLYREGLDGEMTHAELMLRVLGHTMAQKANPSCDGISTNTNDHSECSLAEGSLEGAQVHSDAKSHQLISPTYSEHDTFIGSVSQVGRGALARARRGLVKGYCETTGLPVIVSASPGRVRIVDNA